MSIEEAVADISFQRNMYSAQVKKKFIAFILWFVLGTFAAQQIYTKRWFMVIFHYLFLLAFFVSIPISIEHGHFSFVGVWITFAVYNFLTFGLFWYQVSWHNQVLANGLAGKPNSFWLKTLTFQELISLITSSVAFVALIVCHPFDGVNPTFSNISELSQSSGEQPIQQAVTTQPTSPAPQEFYVGDTLQSGELQVTLNAVKTGTTINSSFESKTASEGGQYVVAIVKVKNIGSKPIDSFDMPHIHLIDSNGNKYSADVDASSAAASVFGDDSKVLSDLNPGIATTSVEAFEVSKDAFNADAWHLKVGDSFVYRLVSKTNPTAQAAAEASPQPAAEPPSQSAPTQATAAQAQEQQPPAHEQSTQASAAQQADAAADLNTNPNQVYATSFDCGESHSQNEYLICHTPALASADAKLANAVTAAKSAIDPTDLGALKERIRGQWNFREKHCNDVACLNTWYTYQLGTMALITQTRNVAARLDTPQS